MSVAGRREVVEFIKTKRISERRSCQLISLNRKTHRYQRRTKRSPSDQAVVERMRELALIHPRFGYRRIHALLLREGVRINQKRVFRLWREQDLRLPKRRPCKKRVAPRVGLLPGATKANQIWTYDFVFDQTLSGRSLKMLTLVDEHTRECLAVEAGVSITSEQVRDVLQRVCVERGALPEMIRSDNGSEFIGNAVNGWLKQRSIEPIYIEPGKPWQNGKCESFNGKLRDELLSREWFSSVREAKTVIEGWRKYYNEERPHSSLGYLTPKEFKLEIEKEKALALPLE